MRSSPSGRRIPNEIIRYSFPLSTALAGLTIAPLWSSPGISPVNMASPALLATPFTALPGRLDLASLSIISSGGNTGSPITLQWVATTTLLPAPAGSPVPNFIDPTAPGGVVTSQYDFSDVIIPDTGAAIAPSLIVPLDLVVAGTLYVLLSVAVIWKDSAIRNPLG